ncbi:MAG: Gfo/Idh/MocA family protein [Candidatus Hodarchaeales archaeon]
MFKEKVSISVIGTGRMGYLHARLLNKLGYLDSVIDLNPTLAEKVGQQFKVPWFTNIEEMVNENSPNGIIIAVPTKKHIEIVQNVVKNKPDVKALLIEKPIASSIEEAEEVKSILERNDITGIIGHIEKSFQKNS